MIIEGSNNSAKVFATIIEDEAINQIKELCNQEFVKDSIIRIMSDVHAGKGCTVGFTITVKDYICPNLIGVDIGCGMLAIQLGKQDIDLSQLDDVIRKYVPYGRNVHEGKLVNFEQMQHLKCYRDLKDTKRLERSIGTLGSGNHFIEIDVDDNENKYLIIHTGSRNLGYQVASHYQDLAIGLCSGKDKMHEEIETIITEYKAAGKKSEISNILKDIKKRYQNTFPFLPKDLCYLSGKYKDDYLNDMQICQNFATENRNFISEIILNHLHLEPISSFETIHNYINFEDNILRKGAISAHKNQQLLIPINMRDGCILGTGKGNADWNYSAPHGAGRLMSRTKAKEILAMADFQNSMTGIYTTSVCNDTLDEAPMAYKPIENIIENIKDTVDIQMILKPIYNFKASE